MKKRFFLIAIFLIFFVGIFIRQGNQEKHYYKLSVSGPRITNEEIQIEHNSTVTVFTPDFIMPYIFIFETCIFVSTECDEFKIGTVDWKPKHRKQLPRGNLA